MHEHKSSNKWLDRIMYPWHSSLAFSLRSNAPSWQIVFCHPTAEPVECRVELIEHGLLVPVFVFIVSYRASNVECKRPCVCLVFISVCETVGVMWCACTFQTTCVQQSATVNLLPPSRKKCSISPRYALLLRHAIEVQTGKVRAFDVLAGFAKHTVAHPHFEKRGFLKVDEDIATHMAWTRLFFCF